MKCDICGTESEFEAAFVKERKSFRKSSRTLCPTCRARRHRTFEGWYQVAVMIGGVIGYVLLWLNPWSFTGRLLTTLFLIDIFLILSIVPHELGHAIIGQLLGWRVFAIVIGIGKQVFKFHLLGIFFSFHWLPVAGLTQVAPVDTRWFRTKRFFVFLAGPAVNAAIVGIILYIWWASWRELGLYWGLPRPARLCLWANFWVMAANLWPHRSRTLNMDTDGKQLLKTFSKKPKDVEELQATRFALEALLRRDEYKDFEGALDWCNKGLALFPQNVALLNMSGILCLDKQNYSRAREIFLQLLKSEMNAGTRYVILNNIAYVDALIGDPELLSEADAYSKEAFSAAPWAASLIGTRGTVLVEMGQLQEGAKLLKEAFEKHHVIRNKALNACHLAIAYARMGDRDQAGKYLKLARELDSQCPLLGRAEVELGRNTTLPIMN